MNAKRIDLGVASVATQGSSGPRFEKVGSDCSTNPLDQAPTNSTCPVIPLG